MNKAEFATVLADRTELSKADANRAMAGILDTLTEAMAEHDEIAFLGWGKFAAQRRKGRDVHDPRNPRRTIHVAPGYVPKFKAGSVLKRETQAGQPAELRPQSEAFRRTPGAETREAKTGIPGSAAAPRNGRGQNGSTDRWRPLGER